MGISKGNAWTLRSLKNLLRRLLRRAVAGASAYCGALASALASMVGNLTVGKKSFAQVEPEVYMRLEKLAALRRRLLELVGEDAQAFGPLAAAYRMPKDTPEQQAAKEAAIQAALVGACEVPLDIMRTAAAVVDHTEFLAYNGSPHGAQRCGRGCGVRAGGGGRRQFERVHQRGLYGRQCAGRGLSQGGGIAWSRRRASAATRCSRS